MFAEFSAPVQISGLTLSAVRSVTDLDWRKVAIDDPEPQIPTDPGVYAWIDPATGVVFYHGSGRGASGLQGRLRTHLWLRQKQFKRLALYLAEGHWRQAWDLASEVPVVRAVAERELDLWCAPARPATWVPEVNDTAPETAVEWETFVSEVSLLAVGHRSILGGGAWEAKPGTLGHRMSPIAWDRMCAVATDWRN
ncbi:hypothetical protein M3G04_04610 [Dietzia cinnamea]|uniref:hypothetical protein n=1 Tax=Dietzia cinnamea TaxID=321318 RepID=UPI00223B752E|nr:hypothetical protein [Dietzia cinnamea]MCT2300185.1 hypothetical protein [Dietzia cinnamea]